MNNSTFIRFCGFGFWFRVRGYGLGIRIEEPFIRMLKKHRGANLISQWFGVRFYKP